MSFNDRMVPVLSVLDVEAAAQYFRDKLGFTIQQVVGERDFLVRGPDGYAIGFWGPPKIEEGTASPPDETGDMSVRF